MDKLTTAENFLEHLDKIFKREPEFFKNESLIEGVKNVTSILYRDYPTIGYITAVTYGLSLVKHPDWNLTRPELTICVESDEINWGIVIGYIANQLRGKAPFTYGNTINFGDKISKDSKMDGFLMFAPHIFEKDEFLNIEIGEDYKINLVGMYPIYNNEIPIYNELGPEKFLSHKGFDAFNVGRKEIRN